MYNYYNPIDPIRIWSGTLIGWGSSGSFDLRIFRAIAPTQRDSCKPLRYRSRGILNLRKPPPRKSCRGYRDIKRAIEMEQQQIREIHPIELLHRSQMTTGHFAAYMGVSERTVQYWMGGSRNPSSQARRLAAELAEKWGLLSTSEPSLTTEIGGATTIAVKRPG